VGPILFKMLAERSAFASARAEIVLALDTLNDKRMPEAMKLGLADDDASVRNAARRVMAKRQPREAVTAFVEALDKGEVAEKEMALTLLGQSKEAEAEAVLSQWLDRLIAGKAPPAVHLELLQAAERRAAPEIKQKLERFEALRKKGDALASY